MLPREEALKAIIDAGVVAIIRLDSSLHFQAIAEALQAGGIRAMEFTMRRSISANHSSLSGILWERDRFYKGPRYEITHIVDRLGSGDESGRVSRQ